MSLFKYLYSVLVILEIKKSVDILLRMIYQRNNNKMSVHF